MRFFITIIYNFLFQQTALTQKANPDSMGDLVSKATTGTPRVTVANIIGFLLLLFLAIVAYGAPTPEFVKIKAYNF